MTTLEIIVIIAAISFVVAVFTKAIINKVHGKCDCPECDGMCSLCDGSCNKYSKEELKKHLKETYIK
ncbi:MAG: hypothetical protein J6Y28_05965 [Acholeplasmatales bacterium]|nr:hypothetical protein [Acholeplasmatales bacterium]